MRHPCQQELFGLNNRIGLSAVLSGRGGPETIQRIPGLPDLSILPRVLPPNPAELLGQPPFARLLKELRSQFDVILLDSPAADKYADAQTIAVRAGAALIVARKNFTRMWRVRGVFDTVTQASAVVVGSVLNDF
jgi:Mrp family chromosome partitioning ATPase